MEHDQSYKLLFSHAELVADLLRGFVCEDGVKALDFTSLEKMSSSYKRRRTSRGALWREIEALLLTKATVVLALLKRAGATMTNGLSPVLTANGFRGLAEFARRFAEDRYPTDATKRRALSRSCSIASTSSSVTRRLTP
jgi:hypothetical protein